MKIRLFKHQENALSQLKTGSILCGGVGSGKSLVAVAYYYMNEMPKDLYIITTAQKRDTLDWERECANFALSRKRESSINNILVTVDSWNNIKKYSDIKHSFFIFDEQRVIGSGAWVKSFLKVVKNNNWILLSATPGDNWLDYIPVFIANGFYKNRTEFMRRHVVFKSFTKFPKIDRFLEERYLEKLKRKVLVFMDYEKKTIRHEQNILVDFDKDKFNIIDKKRWNIYNNQPIKNIVELFFLIRRVVNSDHSRLKIIEELIKKHNRLIIFYNFNYELDLLKTIKDITITEYNGHVHDPISKDRIWIHLVQYTAGSEGWNCIETNAIVFYSLNYSYRIMTQAAGRIDRLTTPYVNLYYYRLISKSWIDKEISKALDKKQNFNERKYIRKNNML